VSNITRDLKKTAWGCGHHSSSCSSEQKPVTGSYEHGNDPSI